MSPTTKPPRVAVAGSTITSSDASGTRPSTRRAPTWPPAAGRSTQFIAMPGAPGNMIRRLSWSRGKIWLLETMPAAAWTPSTSPMAVTSSLVSRICWAPAVGSNPWMPLDSGETLTSASAPLTSWSKLEDSRLVNSNEPATKATPNTIDSALSRSRTLRAHSDFQVACSIYWSRSARRAMERSTVDSPPSSTGPLVGAAPPSR